MTLPQGIHFWTEPESAANTDYPPQYPYNNVTQTKSGHTFEMDDTSGRERIRIQHRANTFIEMHPNGDEVHKVYGNGYEIIIKDKNVEIKGTCNITINGNANMHVLGDKNEKIDGNYTMEVMGNYSQRVRGTSGMIVTADKYLSLSTNRDFGGVLSLSAGSHIMVNGDVEVGGSLSADFLTSKFRIDAGTGLYAGPLGVFTSGMVTAPTATIGHISAGIVAAVLASDVINSARHNFHVHPSPNGVTGIPSLPFLPAV
jgi:hypothetical protein